MSQYDTANSGSAGSSYSGSGGVAVGGGGDVNMAVVTPTDRVRWGPILAGLFTALACLIIHGVLGAAIAGSAYDPGDNARSFGIGAGIWGIISVLISFALGGWVAARSAAVRGHNNGLLNGAMVWAVAIPVLAYVLAGGASRVAQTLVGAAGDAAQATAQATTETVNTDEMNADAQQAMAEVTPEQKERTADATARTAWSTLVALLLGLAAAAAGGYLGARGTDDHRDPDASRRPASA